MIGRSGIVLTAAALCIPPLGSAAQPALPVHHEADVRIDPESRLLTLSDIVTVSGRTEIRLRRAPWLTVERLAVDNRPVPAPATNAAWRTRLPDAGPHRIEIHLRGKIPALQSGRGAGTEQSAALGPEGGYLFEGAGWLPDTGDDGISYRLRVGVPAAYRAVATGRLEDEQIGDAAYTATFSAAGPSPPPALFVGPYDVKERRDGDVRIRTYFHRDLAGQADIYLRDVALYLGRYGTEIGPYPYHDFHVVSAPVPVGLGFPNLTYIGRRIIPLPFIRARSLAHEILHSWWGNGIAVDYRNGNWSEGLTTYMADYALAAERSADHGQQMRLGWLRDYAALPADRDVPVIRFTAKHDSAAQVIGYNKVAFIFHMLKGELGDDAFGAALRRFWHDNRGRRAGWTDIRSAFETASGRDLGWFFDQWLARAGAPRFRLANAAVEPSPGGGKYHLRVTLRQDPPSYHLTIPVVIETETGLRHDRIVMGGRETIAHVETESKPLALHLDRAHDLFRRLLPGEAPPILRDVTLASDAVTVITAEDQATAAIARQLATRLLDTPVRLRPAGSAGQEASPLLVIGTTPDVAAFLARHNLAAMPEKLAGRGTARVWTAYGRDDRPLLAVAADNTEALRALLRPLPHYGGRSYLVFDGDRAMDKGVWPATASPLSQRFR